MAKLRKVRKSPIDEIGINKLLEESIMSRLNCHNVGKIIDFDANTQTCTVEMMQIKQFGEKYYTPAPITQVPLIIYGGGNGFITLPSPIGSYCLLFFMDRNIDNFLITGEKYVPDTGRMHDFSDCIAVTTFSTLANPITNYDEDAISLLNKTIIEEIEYSTFVKIYGNEIIFNSSSKTEDNQYNSDFEFSDKLLNVEISTKTEEENTTSKLNIDSNQISISSGLGCQITTSDKLSISNTNQNLNSLIQAFITACENITTVNGGALTPASKQTFTDLKTQFEELLQ